MRGSRIRLKMAIGGNPERVFSKHFQLSNFGRVSAGFFLEVLKTNFSFRLTLKIRLTPTVFWFWRTHVAIGISVQYDDGPLPDSILSTLCD